MATPSDPRRGPSQVRPAQPRKPAGTHPRKPAGTQPRKPAGTVLQQRAFAALMLAIISLLGVHGVSGVSGNLRRGVVVLAVAMVIGAIGLWLSFTALSRSRKAGTARPRFAVAASV